MPRLSRACRPALLGALLVAPFAPTSVARAATVTVRKACVAEWPGQVTQAIPLTVTGLIPGQAVRVNLEVGGAAVSEIPQATSDAGGAIATQLTGWTAKLPMGPTHSTPARVVVSDVASGAELGAAPVAVTNVGLGFDGSAGRGDTRRTWEVSGLALLGGGPSYWAHYFKGGKHVGKQRLGRPRGACGYLRTRKLLVPFNRKYGTFQVRVQASRRWNADRPWIGGTVTARLVRRDR